MLELTRLLQTSLNLPDLLALFAHELARDIEHAGIRYRTDGASVGAGDDGDYELTVGRDAPHRLSYRLEILDHLLGEIVLMGDAPFPLRAIEHFECMLAALLYPLRNGLLYARALRSALKDPLTGLNNREAMDSYLGREMAAARRYGTPLALLLLDVDHFKRINDGYGHLVGDTVLSEVAGTLVDCCRDSDIVFRYGGEEFVVVLANTDLSGGERVAERIRAKLESQHVDSANGRIAVTASVGVTLLEPSDTKLSFLERADKLLYDAKATGRNRVVCG